jgi:hypothetical protein
MSILNLTFIFSISSSLKLLKLLSLDFKVGCVMSKHSMTSLFVTPFSLSWLMNLYSNSVILIFKKAAQPNRHLTKNIYEKTSAADFVLSCF